mgnify:CR=1 FL=1
MISTTEGFKRSCKDAEGFKCSCKDDFDSSETYCVTHDGLPCDYPRWYAKNSDRTACIDDNKCDKKVYNVNAECNDTRII